MAELRAFVFSDLAGSVRLKRQMPGASDAERDAAFVERVLSPHRQFIDDLIDVHGGRVVSTAGDGHFLVFGNAVAAARWAIDLIDRHAAQSTDDNPELKVEVRLSVHVGAPQLDPRDSHNFVGKTVDYAARLNDLAGGGQILVSRATVALLEDAGLDGVRFHLHGRRRLKGIGEVEIFELLPGEKPPGQLRAVPDEPTPRQWTVLQPSSQLSQLDTQTALAAAPLTDTRIDKYHLVQNIGSGGMGDVWLARHPQFDQPRALKVIKAHLVTGGGGQIVRRFYREIKAIGALSHPNIVVAIDSSLPEDDTHYLVMEYVDGVSASDLVARTGPLSVADACEVIRQAAIGLQYIHRQGLVHRDIKPSNLMITSVDDSAVPTTGLRSPGHSARQPLVKILDLGLALLVGEDHDRLTRLDHGAMGTAMYMSPEQWQTTSVDIRSDIYSLGCTFYHLLTGRPPFYDSDYRPQRAHELAPVPPLPKPLHCPAEVERAVRRMLAKRADDRFATPGEVAEALAPFCSNQHLVPLVERVRGRGGDVTHGFAASDTQVASGPYSDTARGRPATSPSPVSRRNWLLTGGAILSAAVVGGGVIGWQRFADFRRRERRQLRAPTLATAAQFAASQVATEIATRFRILDEAAGTKLLQDQLTQIAAAPNDVALWEPVQTWILREKSLHSEETPSESWFVDDIRGTQVARAPESDKSIGNSYAHRDYFHGQGQDLPKGTTDVTPIAEPNQSAVYESTSTRKLKVAFSVPVSNGARPIVDRRVVGVLAMSVDLGDFEVLEKQLPENLEVVLIDLRQDTIEDEPKRGLILHHPDLPKRQPGTPPIRLSDKLLTRADELLASPREDNAPLVLDDYADPLGGGRTYWGAIHPVVIRRRNDADIDTRWMVLVQELAE